MTEKKRVLFLCTGNSCRSQMAEGWTRRLQPDRFDPYSAGVKPKGVDPRAGKAMLEAGVDISDQRSKDVTDLGSVEFDYVVTLCDKAREACPYFPAGTRVLHRGFEDPPVLAQNAANEEEAMGHYRRIRDQIGEFVKNLPAQFGD
jgi:arsenate reductase (thioredoxin)